MYKANINVTLRKSILDPKGKAAGEALRNLGYHNIKNVRIGKFMELNIDANDEKSAFELAKTACEKLLANEIMEDFTIQIQKV